MPYNQRFDGLYQHSRFAGTRRAVYNCKVICGKDLVNGYLLGRIEGWNKFRDGLEMKSSWFFASKNIDGMCVLFFLTQFDGQVQGTLHFFIAILIEEKINTEFAIA